MIFGMNITAPCVVSLVWRLEDTQGNLIDELEAPVEFFVGGDDLLAKVEEALLGQETGFAAKLHLEPEHKPEAHQRGYVRVCARFLDVENRPLADAGGRRRRGLRPAGRQHALQDLRDDAGSQPRDQDENHAVRWG